MNWIQYNTLLIIGCLITLFGYLTGMLTGSCGGTMNGLMSLHCGTEPQYFLLMTIGASVVITSGLIEQSKRSVQLLLALGCTLILINSLIALWGFYELSTNEAIVIKTLVHDIPVVLTRTHDLIWIGFAFILLSIVLKRFDWRILFRE